MFKNQNMNKSKSTIIYLLLLLLLVLITTTTTTAAAVGGDGTDDDDQGARDQNPKTLNAAERAIGITPPLISPWHSTIRSWFKVAWLHLRPPDSERVDHREPYHPGEMMKEAVSKSFETSKEAAKQSAKAAGDALHKTAEKVKRSVSAGDHQEL